MSQEVVYTLDDRGEIFCPKIKPLTSFKEDPEIISLSTVIKRSDKTEFVHKTCSYSHEQRMRIAFAYHERYHKELKADIRKMFSGDVENLIVSMYEPRGYAAVRQIKNCSINVDQISDILGSASNREIKEILNFIDKDSLAKFIQSRTVKNHENALITLLQCKRREPTAEEISRMKKEGLDTLIDFEECSQIAFNIKHYNSKEENLNFFLEASRWEICAVSKIYQAQFSEDIMNQIKKRETEARVEHLIRVIIRSSEDPIEYFARQLKKALFKLNKDEETIDRIFITRSEKDLAAIEDVFEHIVGESLIKTISNNMNGIHKRTLMYILALRYSRDS